MTRRWVFPVMVTLAGCAVERPARFADAPVVADVADDRPIPLPRRLDPVKEEVLAEAYVEHPMVQALDPTRAPEAGDVNALDEVPRSSWFSPDEVDAVADAAEPPAPPFRVLDTPAVTREGALAVMDARGQRFELWRDPPDRPEMATGGAATASRLLRAIGYSTPGVWATDVARGDFVVREHRDDVAILALFRAGPRASVGRFRVAATRWPIGTDLGPTPASKGRSDDPNDRVAHGDRRTLRALKLVFGWLGMTEAGASVLRDAYLGAPGRGHVVHYVAGLGGALGADAVVRALRPRDDDADLADRNVWITLATLGLYQPKPRLTPGQWPSIGEYRETWSPARFRTAPPFEPMDRAQPADVYWAAKRIAAVTPAAIVGALDAGTYHDDSARSLLGELIRDRRVIAVHWGFAQVTPCEVERLEQGAKGGRAFLVLRDLALSLGIVEPSSTRYRVEMVDETGKRIAEPSQVAVSGGALFPVRLPDPAPAYLVLRVLASRSGREAPRRMEAHLVHAGNAWRVVGVMH